MSRRLRAPLLAALVLGVFAASAEANLQLSVVTPDPVRDLPVQFTASGTTPPDHPSLIEIFGRPASYGPCAARESDDPGSGPGFPEFDGPTEIDPETQSPDVPTRDPNTPFSFAWSSSIDATMATGPYLLCGWVENGDTSQLASVPFNVRAPNFTLAAVAPHGARVGRRNTFVVRGTAEAPAKIDAELLPPYAYSCNGDDSRCVRRTVRGCTAQPEQDPVPNPNEQYWYPVLSRTVKAGASFSFRSRLLARQAGRWHFCAWLQDGGTGQNLGPIIGRTATFTVAPRRRHHH